MGTIWSIVRLIWSPRSLAEVAIAAPWPFIVTASALAIAANAYVTLWVTVGVAANEPYPDVATALLPFSGRLVQGLLLFLVWSLAAVIWVAVTSPRASKRDRTKVRALLLSPIPCTLPILIWLPFGALASVASIAPDIIAGVPSWIESPLVRTLGSPAWLVVLGGFWVYWLVRASRKLTAIFGPDSTLCPACLYDLSGLDPAAPCPECGRPRGAA